MKANKNILSIYGRDNVGDGVNQLDQICIQEKKKNDCLTADQRLKEIESLVKMDVVGGIPK